MATALSFQSILHRFTPEESGDLLAIPSLLILVGVAEPVFPLATRGSPSSFVHVQQTRIYDLQGLSTGLPLSVDWGDWEYAVVPVLQDDRWQSSQPLIKMSFSSPHTMNTLIQMIRMDLVASFTRYNAQ